jgi:hypothetical protein
LFKVYKGIIMECLAIYLGRLKISNSKRNYMSNKVN